MILQRLCVAARFGDKPVTYDGQHYRLTELDGLPKPVQRPRPPLLVGGGGRRVLELAGRTADIVGINARLAAGMDPFAAVADMSPEKIDQRLGWARAAATAAGRAPQSLEYQLRIFDLRVTHMGTELGSTSSLAQQASPETLAASPAVLHGSAEECADKLIANRERYGFNYVHLGSNVDAAAPIVALLAGS